METFKYISCVVCLGMFLACSNDEPVINEPPVVTPNEKPAEAKDIMLAVRPTLDAMKTRAIVEAFQAGHTMGVFTTDNGGGAVGSNVSFAYDGNEWKAGGNAPVKGDMNVTAYFPYSASVTDCREIPVDLTRQEDCLYGTARVTKQVPTAALTMKHALSLVRIKVMKDEYMGQGKVENVTISGIRTRGRLDATDGSVVQEGNVGSIPAGGNYLLNDASPVMIEAVVFPTVSCYGYTVSFDVDGHRCSYEIPAKHEWKAGYIYTYTFNLKGMYNAPVYMEDVPIDVEYWGKYGKTDEIQIRECGEDEVTIRPNYTEYGYECYQNEGKVFGLFWTGWCSFEGKLRFVLMQNGRIVEQYQPIDIQVKSGQWDGKWIQCYVTVSPGMYELVPLFQKKGESTWFMAVDYENGSTQEEWMYEVLPPAPDNLPALRMMQVEGREYNSFLVDMVPDGSPWNLIYTISNKGKGALRGEIQARWEREFKLRSNSYRPSARKKNTINDIEWNEVIGTTSIEIPNGTRFWKGKMEILIPKGRLEPKTKNDGLGYAGPVLHLYWRAEGSDKWILLRQDADFLFNRNYEDDVYNQTTNYLAISLDSWR